MPGNTAQNSLADAGHQTADFARALKAEAGCIRTLRDNLEPRATLAMAQRADAGNLYAAGLWRHLVRQRDLAFERAADRGDAQLQLDLVGVGPDPGHGLAAG